MNITCTRRLEFDAGHRVLGHEGKCASMHGHRYGVEVTCETSGGETTDSLGRVIDFSVIKRLVGEWLDHHWDHGFILYDKDEEMVRVFRSLGKEHKSFLLPYNPTAENLARYLLQEICPVLFRTYGIRAIMVAVYETPNCRAEAYEE